MSDPINNVILEGENLNIVWSGLDQFIMQTGSADVVFNLPDGPAKQCILLMADEFRKERQRLMTALYAAEDLARQPDNIEAQDLALNLPCPESMLQAQARRKTELAKIFDVPAELLNAN